MGTARFKELLKKYGKVALGVHFSVSAASITGLYVAIKNNVDVESVFEKYGIGVAKKNNEDQQQPEPAASAAAAAAANVIKSDDNGDGLQLQQPPKKRNRTAELAASSGGALAVAILCNKALFPVRVPITLALTPPISRFLARRLFYKTGGGGASV